LAKTPYNGCAELVSRVSEYSKKYGVQNGFVVVPSVSDGGCPKWFCCSAVRPGRGVQIHPLRERALQRSGMSKMRSGGVQNAFCCSAVRIGRGFPIPSQREGATTESNSAQRLSSGSEMRVQNMESHGAYEAYGSYGAYGLRRGPGKQRMGIMGSMGKDVQNLRGCVQNVLCCSAVRFGRPPVLPVFSVLPDYGNR